MKKRIAALLLSAFLVLSLASCGEKDNAKTADPKALADDMLKALAPQGETIEVTGDVAANYYEIGDAVKEYRIYLSTMYLAEEVAVFQAADAKDLDTIKVMCDKRITDLKDSFDGYLPEEYAVVEDNAQVLAEGDIVALVIGGKESVEAAKAVFDKALG